MKLPAGFTLDTPGPAITANPVLPKIRLPEGFQLDNAPTDNVKPPTFAGEMLQSAKDLGKAVAEAGGSFVGSMLGAPAAGIAGAVDLARTGGDLESAGKAIGEVSEAFALPPQTEKGKQVEEVISWPFKKLRDLGIASGDWVLDKTNNPELATAVHTGIETLPVWLFPFLKSTPKVLETVKKSNTYRKATIKERGIILQSLEEAKASNPGMTEGELLRKYNNPTWREEALARRNVGEQGKAVEPIITEPVAPESIPQPTEPIVTPERVLPDAEQGFTMRSPEDVYAPYSPELAPVASVGLKRLPSNKVAGEGFVMNPPSVPDQQKTILRKSEENKALQPPNETGEAPAQQARPEQIKVPEGFTLDGPQEASRPKFERQASVAKTELDKLQREAMSKGEVLDFSKPEISNLVLSAKQDETSGFTFAQAGTARHDATRRAQEVIKNDPEQDAFYVEIDIRNLGKLNDELGNSGANKAYRTFSDIVAKHLDSIGAEADKFRHGGDELSSVIVGPGVTAEKIESALFDAMREIHETSATMKGKSGVPFTDIPHSKAQTPEDQAIMKGTGINFAVEPISDKVEIGDSIKAADIKLEQRKKLKAENDNEYTRKVKEIRGISDGVDSGVGAEIQQGTQGDRVQVGAVGTGEKRSFPGRRVSSREINSATDDLILSKNIDDINAKLDDIFGITEEKSEEFDYTGDVPGSLQLNYDLANDYRADIEYAARTRDAKEVRALLKAVSKDRREPEARRKEAESRNLQPTTEVQPPKESKELSSDQWLDENRDLIPKSMKVKAKINGKDVEITALLALKKLDAKIDLYEKISGCL